MKIARILLVVGCLGAGFLVGQYTAPRGCFEESVAVEATNSNFACSAKLVDLIALHEQLKDALETCRAQQRVRIERTTEAPVCSCPNAPDFDPKPFQDQIIHNVSVSDPIRPGVRRRVQSPRFGLRYPIFNHTLPPLLHITPFRRFIQEFPALTSKTTRICLVTSAISGPTLNGGIATAFYSMAKHLALANKAAGWRMFDITVLYAAHPYYQKGDESTWIQAFAADGIKFVGLEESPLQFYGHKYLVRAFRVFEWLRSREDQFDVISYHDNMANGYYVALAKRQQLHFRKTFIFVQCHSTIRWADDLNARPPKDHNTLGYYYMEQKSIEFADARVSPSEYYLHWMEDEGRYNLSQGYSFVVQNLLYPMQSDQQSIELLKTDHFAFFARLEVRKGLIVFCDALDHMIAQNKTLPAVVSFIGPNVKVDNMLASEYIYNRSKSSSWPFKVILEHKFNTASALKYIKERKAVTILPTLGDNSPYALMEIVAYNLPLITTDAGGGKELFVDDPDRSIVVPASDFEALANAMEHAIRFGIKNVAMSSSFTKTRDDYIDLIRSFHANIARVSGLNPRVHFKPTQRILVGITTHNRPEQLFDCVQSIASQEYPTDLLNVLVIDDASTHPDAAVALRKSDVLLTGRQIKHTIIRKEANSFVSVARNEILQQGLESNADFVCFMVRATVKLCGLVG
jgi:glycosyltransferase involved in cell wall biosynthesis